MDNKNLKATLLELFEKEAAHVSFENAIKNITLKNLGVQPYDLPYSIWQLAEHIRITQSDILQFSIDPKHVSPNWPTDFWPIQAAPKSMDHWRNTVNAIKKDRELMIQLIKDPTIDLLKPLIHDASKNLFREALLILDHTSYHLGEIVVVRRLLGDWNG